MRDRYEPPTDPQPWPAFGPADPVRDAGDPHAGYGWDPDYLARSDGPADEARDQGLRRLSMLTLHATGLSVVTAIGFATLFATTAHAQTGTAVTAKPSPGPAAASGTPSPGPTPRTTRRRRTTGASSPSGARRGTGHVRRARPRGSCSYPGPAHHRAGPRPAQPGAHAGDLLRVRPGMRAAPAEAIGARTFSALGTFASLLVTDRRSLELAYGLLTARTARGGHRPARASARIPSCGGSTMPTAARSGSARC